MRNPREVLCLALDLFAEKLDARPGFDCPQRRLIQAGMLVWDAEELVVHTQPAGIYQGLPGATQQGYQTATGGVQIFSMSFGVTLVRCFPGIDDVNDIPNPEVITAASLSVMDDHAALSDAFFSIVDDDSLAPICDTIYYQGITTVGPSGAMLATELSLGIQL